MSGEWLIIMGLIRIIGKEVDSKQLGYEDQRISEGGYRVKQRWLLLLILPWVVQDNVFD